ncbi:MAG: hypothetical protein IT314_09970 [Anaerolineales bacterium]|nr:hypothetical protein [Anaerolineales bacterium]
MNTTKPTLVHIIAWTTLASGIVNIIFGITALSTFIGFICAPFSVLPIILGAFELVYAAKLFGTQPVKPSTNIAVFEIASLLFGNFFAMAVGILSLVFYNDNDVKDYFARLNGTPEPATVVPPAPASLPEPQPFDSAQDKPAPAVEALPSPTEESPASEAPAKLKPNPRKIRKIKDVRS